MLIETLAVGSYLFTAAGLKWLADKIDLVRDNHVKHLQASLDELADRVSSLETRDSA